MKIYVASSWRNERQPEVVARLRLQGHEVYDFRHPEPGDDGFHWSEIDPDWETWSAADYARGLQHPIAQAAFATDMRALEECDICVLVLPSGRSAHTEAGIVKGSGRPVFVLLDEHPEPELMYLCYDAVCATIDDIEVRCTTTHG